MVCLLLCLILVDLMHGALLGLVVVVISCGYFGTSVLFRLVLGFVLVIAAAFFLFGLY